MVALKAMCYSETMVCSVSDQGVLGPVPHGDRDLTGREPSSICNEDGRLTFEGWVVVVKE